MAALCAAWPKGRTAIERAEIGPRQVNRNEPFEPRKMLAGHARHARAGRLGAGGGRAGGGRGLGVANPGQPPARRKGDDGDGHRLAQ